jgi:hypothetical protein
MSSLADLIDQLTAGATAKPPAGLPPVPFAPVPRREGGKPMTQYQPWADSLQTALGVRPAAVNYLPGADPPPGMEYTVRGMTSPNGMIGLRAMLPLDVTQHTYAHELGHLRDETPVSGAYLGNSGWPNVDDPKLSNLSKEQNAELTALAWERWSGRKPLFSETSQIAGTGPGPERRGFSASDVNSLATALGAHYDAAKAAEKQRQSTSFISRLQALIDGASK